MFSEKTLGSELLQQTARYGYGKVDQQEMRHGGLWPVEISVRLGLVLLNSIGFFRGTQRGIVGA